MQGTTEEQNTGTESHFLTTQVQALDCYWKVAGKLLTFFRSKFMGYLQAFKKNVYPTEKSQMEF